MAKILWLNWSGGGNLPPSLGIARVLTGRDHEVVFAGRPEMVPRVESAGFRAVELSQAYAQVERYPQNHFMTRAACYLTSPAVAAQVNAVVAAEAPDLALIDAMFPAALAEAARFQVPSAVVVHTFIFRQLEMWRRIFTMLDGMRQHAGFGSLPGFDELWQARERIIVTTLAQFDAAPIPGWETVRHVGPSLEDEKHAVPATLPWPETDPTPLILMSFSTGFEQRSVEKLQHALDALAPLPVRVVATTGGIVGPGELVPPRNAVALSYAAHDPIMRRAALVVTHGGHGTAMRSLRAGVPMVVIPGLAGDQPYVAAAVQQWGAGRALAGDADVEAIRTACRDVLANPSYQSKARQYAKVLAGVDGAANAADEVETLLADRDRTRGACMSAGVAQEGPAAISPMSA